LGVVNSAHKVDLECSYIVSGLDWLARTCNTLYGVFRVSYLEIPRNMHLVSLRATLLEYILSLIGLIGD
jgi:hypothetical protein